jgi:ceramide glucosyltransferase
MTTLILCAGTFCLAALLLHLITVLVVLARLREAKKPSKSTPRVSVIRPVCGLENYIEATLVSTFRLNCRAYEIIFCVAQANDAALPLIRRLIAQHPAVQARVLVGDERISDNPKLNNLAKGWRAARHDWVVLADSNVLLPPDYIARLFARWQADTGLVCSPPIGCRPQGFWAELECAFLNTYQARWQLFADRVGLGFAQGKTMLWHRKILEPVGGLAALAAEPAEDAAATKLVRKAGLCVHLVSRPFPQPLGRRSAGEVGRRQIRWARLRRDTFKGFHALEILSGSLPPLLAGIIVAGAAGWPVGIVLLLTAAIWYGAEALLASAAGWHLSRWSLCAWLLRDLLIPVLWVTSWLGNDFIWRGNPMRVADRTRPSDRHESAIKAS